MNNESLRNIGIIAHVDAGKTTLSERILFFCHVIDHMGEVADGSTVMDYLPEEQKRGITIGAACISCFWKHVRINLVDTPGHIDFTFEVDRIVRVIDGALVLFSAVDGVEPQSEMVWRQADAYHLPRLVFINKVDRQEADYKATLAAMKSRLSTIPLVLTIPLYSQEKDLLGVIDIIRKEALLFDQKGITKRTLTQKEHKDADVFFEELLETLAEADESFFESWVNNSWTEETLNAAIVRVTQEGTHTPVFCGSAKKNIGIQPLLDAILTFLPKPKEIHDGEKKDCIGFVFKVSYKDETRVSWVRLYQGRLLDGDTLAASSTPNCKETIHLYRIDAEQIQAVHEAYAGDIVAVTGIPAKTGDTLTQNAQDLVLESLPKPCPVLTQTVEPRTQDDYALLTKALKRYAIEDPSLNIEKTESGSYLVSGMGELHLQVLLERLEREYHIHIPFQKPTIVVKETITKEISAQSQVCFEQLGQYGHIELTVAPTSGGNSITYATKTDAQTSCIDNAIQTILASGLRFGPLCDVCVTVTAIESVDGKCTEAGLYKATTDALCDALHKAAIVRLEPIMRISLVCTDETMGSCIHLLQKAHADIVAIEEGEHKIIHAKAPLANILDLPTKLRSATKGMCPILQTFDSFAPKLQ